MADDVNELEQEQHRPGPEREPDAFEREPGVESHEQLTQHATEVEGEIDRTAESTIDDANAAVDSAAEEYGGQAAAEDVKGELKPVNKEIGQLAEDSKSGVNNIAEEENEAEKDVSIGEAIKKIDNEITNLDVQIGSLWNQVKEASDKEQEEKLRVKAKALEVNKEDLKMQQDRIFAQQVLPTLNLDQFRQEPITEINPQVRERITEINNRSRENIEGAIGDFYKKVRLGMVEGVDTNDPESLIERIKSETEKVRDTAGLTVNVNEKKLLDILDSGRYKTYLDLPQEKRIRPLDYEENRIKSEKSLGIYSGDLDEGNNTVYGSMTSDNGVDNEYGGANWGRAVLRLKKEVGDRTTYYDGDSMAGGKYSEMTKKQFGEPEAHVIKALNNIQNAEHYKKGGITKFDQYVEAHVLGGVSLTEDVESIDIPLSRFKERSDFQHRTTTVRKLVREIQDKYPQYKELIRVI